MDMINGPGLCTALLRIVWVFMWIIYIIKVGGSSERPTCLSVCSCSFQLSVSLTSGPAPDAEATDSSYVRSKSYNKSLVSPKAVLLSLLKLLLIALPCSIFFFFLKIHLSCRVFQCLDFGFCWLSPRSVPYHGLLSLYLL